MEIAITIASGAQAVPGPRSLIAGIVCKIAIKRKYIFATLWNCRSKETIWLEYYVGKK